MTGELASGDSALISAIGVPTYEHPDALIQQKKLDVYDDMKKDDQVRAALAVKKFSRLSTPYEFKPASNDAKDVQIAKFVTDVVAAMPGSFVKTLMAVMTALDYGFSVSEKNYDYIKDGIWPGKIGLANIKSRKPHDFEFKMDEHSNLLALIQTVSWQRTELPPEKFILYSYQSLWESPYGTSDLRSAYDAWWSKSVVMRFWNMHLERWASPVLIGRFPPGTSPETKAELLKTLEDLQIGTVAITAEGLTIEPLELKSTGADLYSKAIEKRDSMILRAMLVPELLGMGPMPSAGSYALGKKQYTLFFTMLTFLGNEVEELLMEQLIKQLVDMNFATDAYPTFKFAPFEENTEEEKSRMSVQRAQTLQTLATGGFIDPLDDEVQQAAMEYMNILPKNTGTAFNETGFEMACDALTFKPIFKFTNPDGRDAFVLDAAENMARFELLQDAFRV